LAYDIPAFLDIEELPTHTHFNFPAYVFLSGAHYANSFLINGDGKRPLTARILAALGLRGNGVGRRSNSA
jgi:hypothetical protein